MNPYQEVSQEFERTIQQKLKQLERDNMRYQPAGTVVAFEVSQGDTSYFYGTQELADKQQELAGEVEIKKTEVFMSEMEVNRLNHGMFVAG